MLSWTGIFILVIVGGAILGGLERDAERETAEEWWIDFNKTFTQSTERPLPNDISGNATAIAAATKELVDALGRMGTCSLPDKSESNWDLSPATIYLFTAISTIGYGSFSVGTGAGRRFIVIYCTLFLWVFAAALQLLSDCLVPVLEAKAAFLGPMLPNCIIDKVLVAITCSRGRKMSSSEQLLAMFFFFGAVFGSMVLFLSLGAALFLTTSASSYLDGFWFLFVTSSTIGFGDTVPDFKNSEASFFELSYVTVGFVIIALAVDTCTDLFSKDGMRKLHLRISRWIPEMALDAVAKNQGSSTRPEKEEGANRTSKRALALKTTRTII
jgi:hypothetical protein